MVVLFVATLGGFVRWRFSAGGVVGRFDGIVGVIGVFGGIESLFQCIVFGVVVFGWAGLGTASVLAEVFVAMGVDGGVVRASDGDFLSSFVGGKSGMVIGANGGNVGEACVVFGGI